MNSTKNIIEILLNFASENGKYKAIVRSANSIYAIEHLNLETISPESSKDALNCKGREISEFEVDNRLETKE